MRTAAIGLLGLGLVAACSHAKPMQHIDDGALVRLNEQQMQPVDAARIEAGRSRDQMARAKAAVHDGQAKIDIAKAEREVAVAQLKRAQAELDLLTHQKADTKDLDRANQDLRTAQQRVQAVDLKLDYLNRNLGVVQLEEKVAEAHAQVAEAAVERSKYQALQGANSNEVRGLNPALIDQRMAEAQVREANLRKQAADKRVELVEAYNRWQELDAKVRTSPAPAQPATPQALPAEPTTH